MDFSEKKKHAYQLAGKGKLQEAKVLFEELSRHQKSDADVWFMLGAVSGSSGLLDESIVHLKKALDLQPRHIDALYNLGIAYLKKELYEQSACHLRLVLDINRNFHNARMNLAIACCEMGDYGDAVGHFQQLMGVQPDNEDVYLYCAQARIHLGDYANAVSDLNRVLRLNPSQVNASQMLGDAFKATGNYQKAAEAYRKVIQLKPKDAKIYRNLGFAFKSMDMPDQAILCFREALRINPDMHNLKYNLASLGVLEVPERAPADYVEKLFDYFSDHFEEKLVNELAYKTPYVLNELIRRHLTPGNQKFRILDLGCGTGLCGPLVKDIASTLVGVDLSSKMLEKARAKSVYDDLVVGDITEKLFPQEVLFDLIIAAEVFIYIGDLVPVFEASRSLLGEGGMFVFSTEKSNKASDFELPDSGRYKHSESYLTALAGRFGFRIEESIETEIRKNKGVPVMGDHVLLRKQKI